MYLDTDRPGFDPLGYPRIPPIGHVINLAELTVLVAFAYVGILSGAALFRAIAARRQASGRAFRREVRGGFTAHACPGLRVASSAEGARRGEG